MRCFKTPKRKTEQSILGERGLYSTAERRPKMSTTLTLEEEEEEEDDDEEGEEREER